MQRNLGQVEIEINIPRDVSLRVEVQPAVVHLDLWQRQQRRGQPRGQGQMGIPVGDARYP